MSSAKYHERTAVSFMQPWRFQRNGPLPLVVRIMIISPSSLVVVYVCYVLYWRQKNSPLYECSHRHTSLDVNVLSVLLLRKTSLAQIPLLKKVENVTSSIPFQKIEMSRRNVIVTIMVNNVRSGRRGLLIKIFCGEFLSISSK